MKPIVKKILCDNLVIGTARACLDMIEGKHLTEGQIADLSKLDQQYCSDVEKVLSRDASGTRRQITNPA